MHRLSALVFAAVSLYGFEAASPAHFRLEDTNGSWHTESEWKDASAVVLVFLAIDCPISNGYVPELRRIFERYGVNRVKFLGVQPDPNQDRTASAAFVRDFGLPFPLVLDPKHVLVSAAGATITPEVAVLTPAGAVRYIGRIDNLYAQIGQKRYAATEFDLKDALDALLAAKPVAKPRTKAVGCSIPRL